MAYSVKDVYCPNCDNVKMDDIKRKGGFHKKTKYKCPECGLVRMKRNRRKRKKSKRIKFDY